MRALAAAVLVACLLGGCVTFSDAPGPLACDARLAGTWVKTEPGVEPATQGTDERIEVDPDCRARLHMPGKPPIAFELKSATVGDARFLVFSEAEVERIFGIAPPGPATGSMPAAGAVVLVRYRVEGDALEAVTADVDRIAAGLRSGALQGRLREPMGADVVADAESLRTVLADPTLFPFEGREGFVTRARRVAGTP